MWAPWLTLSSVVLVAVSSGQYYGGTLHWEAAEEEAATAPPHSKDLARIRIVSSLALSSSTCSLNETWSYPEAAGSAKAHVLVAYRCAGASEQDGWKILMSSFTVFTSGGTVRHRACCWRNASLLTPLATLLGTNGYLLESNIDPRIRSDTNRSNKSPIASFPPLIRVNADCESEHRIVAMDPDGDRVRCRYARGSECTGGCGNFPNAELIEDLCVFRFAGPAGPPLAGAFGVTVVVEDLPASTIYLNESTRGPDDALSSVPLHFTVAVTQSGYPCTAKAAFVGPTPRQGASVCAYVGRTLLLPVNAIAPQTPHMEFTVSVTHLVVYGGDIVVGGDLVRNYKDPNLFQTSLKWSIAWKDVGKHFVCFFAVDSTRQQSDLRCITVVVLDLLLPSVRMLSVASPLLPVQMSVSNTTYADRVTFTVTFSSQVACIHSAAARVRFHEADSGRFAYAVNASDCWWNPRSEISFSTPPFTFRGAVRYCARLAPAAKGASAGRDSETRGDCNWMFIFPRRVFASGRGEVRPHYKSFDGRHFDYMGTKPLMLAGTCNETAINWSVYSKNERRGTRDVRWTKKVWIFVDGFRITLDSSGARVNDAAVNMPYRDPSYRFHIFRSQRDYVLRTNLEFAVKFGDSRVVVELENPILYGRIMCGLLGNYNGDAADDFTAPGINASTGAQFGNHWIVDFLGESGLADDGSSERVPQATPSQFQPPSMCDVLSAGSSSLGECGASTVDAAPYHAACVSDLTAQQRHGRQLADAHAGACRAVQAFVDDCLAAGGRIDTAWRNVTGCARHCPPTSLYSVSVSACPASCGDLDAELNCGDPPREGCVCPAGHVWDDNACVLPAACGCTRGDGKYYSVGDSYTSANCSARCTCVALDEVACRPHGAHDATASFCGVDREGIHGSHPRWATCYVGGHTPRFQTFDGRSYAYRGTQTIVLTKPCNFQSGDVWRVLVKSKPLKPLWTISKLFEIQISLHGLTLKLLSSGNLLVDGIATGVPFIYRTPGDTFWVVTNSGTFLILDAATLGLQVYFHYTGGYAHVRVRASYWGRLCGLCGNMDGNPLNDFRLPTGAVAHDAASFGNAWEAAIDWNAGHKEGAPSAGAVAAATLLPRHCGRLTSDATLSACHRVVDVLPYYDSCVAELALAASHTAACESLEAYRTACALAGVQLGDWRASTGCPTPTCPQNSHHEACAAACPATCADLEARRRCGVRAPCLEGCVCDLGHVWSGPLCVLPERCGCVNGSSYYGIGATFRDASCTRLCKCTASHEIECSPFTCRGFCVLKGETHYCVPKKKQCHVMGDPHLMTFDGMTLDVEGGCNYTLLALPSRPGCSVVAQLERDPVSAQTFTAALHVTEARQTVTVQRGFVVHVNGVRRSLPVRTRSVVVLESARHVLLFSIAEPYLVRLDGRSMAMIEVLSLENRTAGLCGNNNGRPDDFTDAVAFSSSWITPPNNSKCELSNPTAGGLALQSVSSARAACSLLTLPTGPFAACHAALPPAWWYRSCVADVAAGEAPHSALCALLQGYHALCRERMVYLGEWRAAARCELACPAHSHYTLCAHMCPPSCTRDSDVCDWPCVEGCQCEVGFFKHDGECIAEEDCGCVERSDDGVFYHRINAEFYNADCSRRYTCHRNRTLTSQRASCSAAECKLSHGAYSCEQGGRMEVECHGERMSARIPKAVLLGLNVSSLRLLKREPGCELSDAGDFVAFNVSLADCGTDLEENERDFVFTQTVTITAADTTVVTYSYVNILINVVCNVPRFKLLSGGALKANWSKVYLEQIAYTSLDLKMDFYKDAEFASPFSPNEYPLVVQRDQRLFLQVSIKSVLDLTLFTIDCYGTPTKNSQDSVKHYLISEGCLNLDTRNHTASSTARRFSFKAFAFTMADVHPVGLPLFYVHCYMLVCKRSELESRCWRGCDSRGRARRSTVASISTPVYLLTRGPLVWWHGPEPALQGTGDSSQPTWIATTWIATTCVATAALLAAALCAMMMMN